MVTWVIFLNLTGIKMSISFLDELINFLSTHIVATHNYNIHIIFKYTWYITKRNLRRPK